MLTMNSSDIRQNFSEILEKAKLEPIEITKRGKPLGAIIMSYQPQWILLI